VRTQVVQIVGIYVGYMCLDVSNAVGPHLVYSGLSKGLRHSHMCIYIYQYDAEIRWIGFVKYELSYVLEVLEVVGVGGCVWTISF
jgi:hypothetical protein